MNPEDFENYEQNVLEAILKFNSLFSEYIKQMDNELWLRAVDYAKSFAESGVVTFDYATEKNSEVILSNFLSQQIFIKELATDIEQIRDEYFDFVEKNSNLSTEQIMNKWISQEETTEDDPFGYERDIKIFIDCDHKFDFDSFDDDDWLSYTNICITSIESPEFQHKYTDILLEKLGEESDVYQYYIRSLESLGGDNDE